LSWIKNIINELLTKYETNEPTELCQYLGINITYEFLGEQDLLAYYLNSGGYRFIVVHDSLDYYDRRVSIAHELGHALLHPDLNTSFLKNNTFQSADKYEHQANVFAANLLLPDGFEKDTDFEGMTIEQIAEMMAMPVELLIFKMKTTTFNNNEG